ncbi:MAG: ABC transporter permease [Candidatus Hermodarchaeota archaeon]
MSEEYSQSNDAIVKKFSFRPFEGIRRGRFYRLWAISWYWWAHQWERSRAIKILIGFLIFILVITNLVLFTVKDILLTADPTLTTNTLLKNTLLDMVRGIVGFETTFSADNGNNMDGFMFNISGLSIFILILVVLVGSGLIADDISNKTNEIYYSKLEKYEYVIGKFGAFYLFGNLTITLPYVIEFFLLVIGLGEIDIIEALPVLIHVIIFTQIVIVTYAAIILALSSITSRRLYAGLSAFMLMFIINMIFPILVFTGTGEFELPLLLDVLTILMLTSYILDGTTIVRSGFSDGYYTINLADGAGLESWMVLGALGVYVLIGLLVVIIQVFWRHNK